MVEGVVFGLIAAIMQSLCYVFSRIFVTRSGNSSRALFGLCHAWMGLMALALLPFCWSTETVAAVSGYVWPLVGAIVFYMIGQMCLFQAIRWTDASRVSPLLGLKVLILAVITVCFMRQSVTALQWVAVFMCVAAAFVLNYSGGRIPWPAVVVILGTCVAYSFSDLSIVGLTRAMAPDGGFRGRLLACCLCYIPIGLVGLAMALGGGREQRTWEKWRAALPVALTWFVAMVALFVCFSSIGAVFGNIVQSMRGPISIVLGVMIARLGHVHLETRVAKGALARRIMAALLMCAAVGLFARERARENVTDASIRMTENGNDISP